MASDSVPPVPGGLSFHLLGPLHVRRPDGSSVELGGPQPRIVLARLLLARGRAVTVDALMDALWEDDPPDSAAGTLQTYVSRLRKAFGPEYATGLRYSSGAYSLDVQSGDL